MIERAIMVAVVRADMIICAALRIGRLALCVALGVMIGRLRLKRMWRK